MDRLLRRLSTVWIEIVNLKLRCVGYFPMHMFRRFFYRLFGMKIGSGSTLHMFATFYDVRNIKIGRDTVIGEWAVLDGRAALTIGDHVATATGVMIYNGEHDINDENFKAKFEPVVIEDYVFIGPRAIILPGVTVKKGAVVAAGAVVTRDVDEFTVVGGVPAKPIAERSSKNPSYKVGRAAWFR